MVPVKGKDDLLRRVRTALHGRRCTEQPGASIPVHAGAASPAERIGLFRSRFEAHGGTFVSGPSAESVARPIGQPVEQSDHLMGSHSNSIAFPRTTKQR